MVMKYILIWLLLASAAESFVWKYSGIECMSGINIGSASNSNNADDFFIVDSFVGGNCDTWIESWSSPIYAICYDQRTYSLYDPLNPDDQECYFLRSAAHCGVVNPYLNTINGDLVKDYPTGYVLLCSSDPNYEQPSVMPTLRPSNEYSSEPSTAPSEAATETPIESPTQLPSQSKSPSSRVPTWQPSSAHCILEDGRRLTGLSSLTIANMNISANITLDVGVSLSDWLNSTFSAYNPHNPIIVLDSYFLPLMNGDSVSDSSRRQLRRLTSACQATVTKCFERAIDSVSVVTQAALLASAGVSFFTGAVTTAAAGVTTGAAVGAGFVPAAAVGLVAAVGFTVFCAAESFQCNSYYAEHPQDSHDNRLLTEFLPLNQSGNYTFWFEYGVIIGHPTASAAYVDLFTDIAQNDVRVLDIFASSLGNLTGHNISRDDVSVLSVRSTEITIEDTGQSDDGDDTPDEFRQQLPGPTVIILICVGAVIVLCGIIVWCARVASSKRVAAECRELVKLGHE